MQFVDLSKHVSKLIEKEIAEFCIETDADRALLAEFQERRVKRPRPITVNFSGGITQICYSVTQSDGDYAVYYLPTAGYFSLCVDGIFGPMDIGVHGPALQCFGSV